MPHFPSSGSVVAGDGAGEGTQRGADAAAFGEDSRLGVVQVERVIGSALLGKRVDVGSGRR